MFERINSNIRKPYNSNLLTYAILISILLLIISFTPLRLISMIGVIVLWALYWPFSKRINSFIFRLSLSFVLSMAFLQLVAVIFWLINIKFTIPVVIILELIVYLTLLIKNKPTIHIKIINTSDIVSLIVAFVSVGVFAFGILSGGPLLQQLIRNATTGFDANQHIYLTEALYKFEGYAYGNKPSIDSKSISPVMLKSYPQGWSLTSSIWWHSVTSSLNIRRQPAEVLFLFYLMVAVWWGTLIYLFSRSILFILEITRNKKNDAIGYTGSIMFTILAELLFFINILRDNFVSFLPVLVFSVALVILVADFLNNRIRDRNPSIFLIGGLILSGGVMMSWLLTAPIDYIMVLTALIISCEGSFINLIKWLISKPILARNSQNYL